MRLTELHPQFLGEDTSNPTDFINAVAIEFDCPGCAGTSRSHRIFAPFQGKWAGGGPKWAASGTGYTDLTFSDTREGSRSIRMLSRCKSHFNVTQGAIDFYGDSGHTQPQERPMTDPIPGVAATNTTTEQGASAATQAAKSQETPSGAVVAPESPMGYIKTHTLEFVNGILHQLHVAGHTGQEPAKVLVPVAGTSTPPGLLAGIEESVSKRLAAFEDRLAVLEKVLTSK